MTAASRESFGAREMPGPALITDYGSTTLVPPGWTMKQDRAGSLIVRRAGASATS